MSRASSSTESSWGDGSNVSSPYDPIRRRVEIQGFRELSDARLRELDQWIRFTPFLTALIALAGTLSQLYPLLILLGAMDLLAAVIRRHPFEIFYDRVIRPLEESPELPSYSARRRMVFAVAAIWSLAAAGCLATGHGRWGYALGLAFAASRGFVATHQICPISEALERAGKIFRRR
jgi:hypothetical protein